MLNFDIWPFWFIFRFPAKISKIAHFCGNVKISNRDPESKEDVCSLIGDSYPKYFLISNFSTCQAITLLTPFNPYLVI